MENSSEKMNLPNQYLLENPALYLSLRQDLFSNARFLWGATLEYDILTAFENKTSKDVDDAYDGERTADSFEVSLVGYRTLTDGTKEGKILLESTGGGQCEAMHLMVTAIQGMVKKAKSARWISLGDTFSGVNYQG